MSKILIVEDEASIASLLESQCRESGFETAKAPDLKTARELFEKQEPDVVFLDITLRGNGDGFEVADFIRLGGDTPIIFITGHSDYKTLERAQKFKNSQFLIKPIKDAEMDGALKQALGEVKKTEVKTKHNFIYATFRKLTVSGKLAACLGAVLILTAGLYVALVSFLYESHKKAFIEQMTVAADSVGFSARAALEFEDSRTAGKSFQFLRQIEAVEHGVLFAPDGSAFTRYLENPKADSTEPRILKPGYEFADDRLEILREIKIEGELAGTVFLRIKLDKFNSELGKYVWIATGLAAFLFCFIIFIFRNILQDIVQPILNLAEHSLKIKSTGDYSSQLDHDAEDEIGTLVSNYNEMIRSISDYQKNLELRVEERTSQLQKSLNRNEKYLREIHHRVRNHFSSMMARLKSRGADREIIETIYRMADLHETVYDCPDVCSIDMEKYLPKILNGLWKVYEPKTINLKVDCDSVSTNAQTALTVGTLVQEMVSNSLKHAWPNGGVGEIFVQLKCNGNESLDLMVRDDGVGVPLGEEANPSSFGMKYIMECYELNLLRPVELSRDGGTIYRVAFENE
jgi:two-component sensor histidine kinase/DNA-binding response OmpR family regulator